MRRKSGYYTSQIELADEMYTLPFHVVLSHTVLTFIWSLGKFPFILQFQLHLTHHHNTC